jgi:hypothetical protein
MKQQKKKNANLPEGKEKSITFGINNIRINRFILVEPGIDITLGFDVTKLKVGFNLDFAYILEQNIFHIIFGITYHYDLNGKDIQLLDLSLITEFLISDIKAVLKVDGDKFIMPDDLLINFTSLAYSTARGILFANTQGSYLNHFILPLIDPKIIVQNKLDSNKITSSQSER